MKFTDLELFKKAAREMCASVDEDASTGLSTACDEEGFVGLFQYNHITDRGKGVLFATNAEFEEWETRTNGVIR